MRETVRERAARGEGVAAARGCVREGGEGRGRGGGVGCVREGGDAGEGRGRRGCVRERAARRRGMRERERFTASGEIGRRQR